VSTAALTEHCPLILTTNAPTVRVVSIFELNPDSRAFKAAHSLRAVGGR